MPALLPPDITLEIYDSKTRLSRNVTLDPTLTNNFRVGLHINFDIADDEPQTLVLSRWDDDVRLRGMSLDIGAGSFAEVTIGGTDVRHVHCGGKLEIELTPTGIEVHEVKGTPQQQ
jgi:hypothetical protein